MCRTPRFSRASQTPIVPLDKSFAFAFTARPVPAVHFGSPVGVRSCGRTGSRGLKGGGGRSKRGDETVGGSADFCALEFALIPPAARLGTPFRTIDSDLHVDRYLRKQGELVAAARSKETRRPRPRRGGREGHTGRKQTLTQREIAMTQNRRTHALGSGVPFLGRTDGGWNVSGRKGSKASLEKGPPWTGCLSGEMVSRDTECLPGRRVSLGDGLPGRWSPCTKPYTKIQIVCSTSTKGGGGGCRSKRGNETVTAERPPRPCGACAPAASLRAKPALAFLVTADSVQSRQPSTHRNHRHRDRRPDRDMYASSGLLAFAAAQRDTECARRRTNRKALSPSPLAFSGPSSRDQQHRGKRRITPHHHTHHTTPLLWTAVVSYKSK